MAALMSSPLGPSMRFDLFDQHPSSPTLRHQDLPAEFGDRSFGSSMSLGSSFELPKGASLMPGSVSGHHSGNALGDQLVPSASPTGSFPSPSPSSSSSHLRSSPSPSRSSPVAATTASPRRASPIRSHRLGAAMGTQLNDRSPGLAAKMSSPYYMDISPAPSSSSHVKHLFPSSASSAQEMPSSSSSASAQSSMRTPNVFFSKQDSNESPLLPPGSAMKEDTPLCKRTSLRKSSRPSSRPSSSRSLNSRCSSRRSSPVDGGAGSRSSSPAPGGASAAHANNASGAGGGSLGRLFGTCLSINSASLPQGRDNSFDSGIDPDTSFENQKPAAKRRPSALNIGEIKSTHVRPPLRSAGFLQTSSSGSLKPVNSSAGSSSTLMNSFRGSDTSLRRQSHDQGARKKMHRCSEPSMGPPDLGGRESGEGSTFDSAIPTSTSTFEDRIRERAENMGLAPRASHNTIIESPSPGTFERQDLGSYFFDPQSPETSQQQVLAAPAQLTARPRTLMKCQTEAALSSGKPAQCSTNDRNAGNTLAQKKRTADERRGMTMLRPFLQAARPTRSSEAVPGESISSRRLTAPAPRRALSSLDHASAMAPAREGGISMLDGSAPSAQQFPDDFDGNGSPIAPASKRPGLLRLPSKDDSSPLPYGVRRGAALMSRCDTGSGFERSGGGSGSGNDANANSSYSAECMPGFGASERSGKVLPCFSVKEDGLMRITPETLVELLQGRYNDQLESYQVIDCRFGYEHQGGHIPSAINLSTVEQVKDRFLRSASLPPRSQSGKLDQFGNLRKPILVFHCEFSVKRAPTMALALRQADRALASDYPNCHYPEVYILQGGYSGFYKSYSQVCEPQAYVTMDDPSHQQERSSELNCFRKQFSRHRSFAYGENQKGRPQSQQSTQMQQQQQHLKPTAPSFLRDPRAKASMVGEESGDSSFEQDASPSNVAAVKKRQSHQLPAFSGATDRQYQEEEQQQSVGLPASSSAEDTSIDSEEGDGDGSLIGLARRGNHGAAAGGYLAHNRITDLCAGRRPSLNARTPSDLAEAPVLGRRPFLRAGTIAGYSGNGRS